MNENNAAWTIKEGDRVRISKRMGKSSSSLPEGYELEGYVGITPTSGKPLYVNRYMRNGIQMRGEFTTSPVKMISYIAATVALLHTTNSIWRIELLEERKEE